MEEDQEDLNELMKKHKAAVAQVYFSPLFVFLVHCAQGSRPWETLELPPQYIIVNTTV